MFNKFRERPPTFYIDDVVVLTLEFIDVSVMSIYSIRKEKSLTSEVFSPVKERKRIRKVLHMSCDEFVRSAVHRKIHSLYANNELPTLKSVDSNKY